MIDLAHLAFNPRPTSLEETLGLGGFPLEGLVEQILESGQPASITPTGLTRAGYLDLIEVIVSTAAGWQDESGAIIDPVYGKEWGQTTSRFASSGAVLQAFGRLPALLPAVKRSMDWVCSRLPRGLMDAPDFQTREIMTAYFCLEGLAQPEEMQRWADGIRAIDPERVYHVVSPSGEGIERLHNWNLYACAGEAMRHQTRFGPQADFLWGENFFHKYAPAQMRHHFTANGMYRDPDDPITYDIQSRLQLAIALAYGYSGEWRPAVEELLRRGALTTLLFLTPDGLVPFGGRSDQFHFREVAVAALCELEAARYRSSRPALAGAFKRQAHRSVQAIRRWLIDMQPLRHLKNGFDPLENWGTDTYGYYSVYSLLTASLLGLAALFADDSIVETPCPSEIGGYTFTLQPAFHKIYSSCAGTFLAIDTAADLHHNATGLGSFQRLGVPTETALAMPFTNAPKYNLPEEYYPREPIAVGPAWMKEGRRLSLAAMSDGLQASMSVVESSPMLQMFQTIYKHAKQKVQVDYRLRQGSLQVVTEIPGAESVSLLVPLLMDNGMQASSVVSFPGRIVLRFLSAEFHVVYDSSIEARIAPDLIGNRNGRYRVLELSSPGDKLTVELMLLPAAAHPPAGNDNNFPAVC